jgi:hypothetical protein
MTCLMAVSWFPPRPSTPSTDLPRGELSVILPPHRGTQAHEQNALPRKTHSPFSVTLMCLQLASSGTLSPAPPTASGGGVRNRQGVDSVPPGHCLLTWSLDGIVSMSSPILDACGGRLGHTLYSTLIAVVIVSEEAGMDVFAIPSSSRE